MSGALFYLGILLVSFNPLLIEAQNPCAWVFSGKIAHPDPTRCNEYFSCTFFIGSLRNCGTHEIFDSDLRSCIPGDPSSCFSSTSQFPTTTENIQTTTELNLAEICDEVFFSARPHPVSKILFIGCIRGDGIIMTCLYGEIFDSNLLKCVLVPDICEVPIDICANTRLEIAANPCHCHRFFVCYLGAIKEERDCGIGLIFDELRNECVPGNKENCQPYPGITESTLTPTSTSSQTITTSSSTPAISTTSSWSNPCKGVLLGNQPNLSNCTMFYRCVNEVPFPQECPVGMIFSRELSQCVVGNENDCDLKR